MSDNVTDDTELFDSDSSESSADTGSDTTEQLTESDGDDADVELKEPKKLSAEQQAQKQVNAWTQKVINGDVDLDELPKDVKWLKKSIEKKLKLLDKQPEIQDLVAKEVAKKEDEREFLRLKGSLKDMSLTKEQKKELQTTFSELSSLPKSKALSIALKSVGAKMDTVNEERRKNAALPKPGTSTDTDNLPDFEDRDNFTKLPLDKKMEIMEAKRRQGMNLV